MRNILFFLTVFTAVAFIGCGGGAIPTINVTGTVTLDGVPVADAEVTFSPKVAGAGSAGYAMTDDGGRYTLSTHMGKVGAGTTPGDYLVSIRKQEPDMSAPEPPSGYPRPLKDLIPSRYNRPETSGLTATVENKSIVVDFALTSQ